MSRLVVVSNRVADLTKPAAGGLAVGLGDALKERGGLWFGWGGEVTEGKPDTSLSIARSGPVTMATMTLNRQDYEDYYSGFSNSVLWPMLHYRLDLVDFQASYLEAYRRVNEQFADALSPLLEPDDLIWIHDYHLFPLAAALRARGHRHKIGFFLHIPFAPPEIVSAVPDHEWLIETLFSYDLIGFQTRTDLGNFRHHVQNFCNGKTDPDGRIHAFGQTIVADDFPIGIDVESVARMAGTEEAKELLRVLNQRILNRRMIIGVDRLDYSKGLPDRMRAFRLLLQKHPDTLKTVTFMQIAPPTREDVEAYADIRDELESLSGAINGEFADFDWTPLRYIHRPIPRETLASLFRGSKVGFVTPLRDGMNIVAKEYIAAQGEEDPGVLILSKFAGAAEQLEEALIVNPYDVEELAQSLCQALGMDVRERRERQAALLARIKEFDAKYWQNAFLSRLEEVPARS